METKNTNNNEDVIKENDSNAEVVFSDEELEKINTILQSEIYNSSKTEELLKSVKNFVALDTQKENMVKLLIGDFKKKHKISKRKDPRIFYSEWLDQKGWRYEQNYYSFLDKSGKPIDQGEFDRTLHLDAAKIGISKELALSACELHKIQFRKAKRERMELEIKYNPEINADLLWRGLSKAISGEVNELDIIVLKHFVKTVKQKLLLKHDKASKHMMPVFYGPQEAGKSELMKRFLKMVAPVTNFSGKFTMYSDQRELFNLTQYHVIMFDEMAKAERADVESIKNGITSERITYRVLGTNTQSEGMNNHLPIGASNLELHKIIRDTTGARRFWQIYTLKKMDWDYINSCDFSLIWQSVDEDKEYIEEEQLKLIRKTQEEFIRARTQTELYVEDNIEVGAVDVKDVRGQMLYDDFKSYVKNNSLGSPMSSRNFFDELVKLGFEKTKGREGVMFKLKYVPTLSVTMDEAA